MGVKQKIDIVYIPVGDLRPAEYNPRQATKEQYEQLKRGIQEEGFVVPILANSNEARKNIVIGGHFRLRVAKDIGMETVPVVYIDLPDIEDEKRLNLRLNKNMGDWDTDLLANFNEEMLLDVGFTEKDFDDFLNTNQTDKAECNSGSKRLKHITQVVIDCEDETEQERIFNILKEQGFQCRVLTL